MGKKVLPNTSLPSPSKDLSNKISSYLYSQNDLENSKKFLDIKPFPYVVIDDFLPREICNQIEEYGRKTHYRGGNDNQGYTARAAVEKSRK